MVIAKAAREVLSRCEYFYGKLREDPAGIDWEAQFSAALALLRSVGHVLDKTDGATNILLDAKEKEWWKDINANKNNHAIFWEFIENERNLILKEGQLRAGQSTAVFIQGVSAIGLAGGQSLPPPLSSPKALTANHSYHMNDGMFAGRDPRDLIELAIQWWNAQLIEIETAANA
jgi:hypothetical protein